MDLHRTTPKAARLNRWAANLAIGIASVHLVVFSVLAWSQGYVSEWLDGGLRGLDVSRTFGVSPPYGWFWASLGSVSVPVIILGFLTRSLVQAGLAVPGFVGYAMAVWTAICAAIFEPSGFPVAFVVALMLIAAHRVDVHARSGSPRPVVRGLLANERDGG